LKGNNSLLHKVITRACKGTTISFREIFSTLSVHEIDAIKAGEIGVQDLKDLIDELVDSKSNIERYTIPIRKNQPQDINLL
jgi:hypothetical protein